MTDMKDYTKEQVIGWLNEKTRECFKVIGERNALATEIKNFRIEYDAIRKTLDDQRVETGYMGTIAAAWKNESELDKGHIQSLNIRISELESALVEFKAKDTEAWNNAKSFTDRMDLAFQYICQFERQAVSEGGKLDFRLVGAKDALCAQASDDERCK